VDVGLGSLYLDAGIGYPLGITYSAAAEEKDVFVDIITLNADGSQLSAPNENFDIKVLKRGYGFHQFWSGHPRIGSLFGRDALLYPGNEKMRILYIRHYL